MSALEYAKLLLHETGAPPGLAATLDRADHAARSTGREPCAAADWARSGALPLVGFPNAAPCLPTAPLATAAAGAAQALAAFHPVHRQLDGARLLGERAALEGLTRQGRSSPGGSCRLLPARDGFVAVNMPRGEEDFRLLPAWLGVAAGDAPWRALSDALARCDVEEAVSRARLLGLAASPAGAPVGGFDVAGDGANAGAPRGAHVASRSAASDGVQSAALPDDSTTASFVGASAVAPGDAHAVGPDVAGDGVSDAAPVTRPVPWLRVERLGARAAQAPHDITGLRVLDLSALWAGPLCGQLIALSGAHVVKMESRSRPDAARHGSPRLFALLNGAKQQVCLDWNSEAGRAELARAFEAADVVIEASRPRALQQLGFVAEHWLAQRPGRVWCSITGYGRRGAAATYAALGDDAAAAAGLCFCVPADDAPLFVGDAVADPLTGVHAALACAASLQRGGGELLDISLCGVTARAIAFREQAPVQGEVRETSEGFEVLCSSGHVPLLPPAARNLDVSAQRESAARNVRDDAYDETSAQQTRIAHQATSAPNLRGGATHRGNSAQHDARSDTHTTSRPEGFDQPGARNDAHDEPPAPKARAAS